MPQVALCIREQHRSPVRETHNLPIPHPPDHLILLVLVIRVSVPAQLHSLADVRTLTTDPHALGLHPPARALLPYLRGVVACARVVEEGLEHTLERARQILARDPRGVRKAARRAKQDVRLGRGWRRAVRMHARNDAGVKGKGADTYPARTTCRRCLPRTRSQGCARAAARHRAGFAALLRRIA